MTIESSEKDRSAAAEIEKIEDNEEYIQRRRLKEIYDAKEEIREKRGQIDLMIEDPDYPQVDKARGARLYRSAVEDYLMAVEPLLVNTYPNIGERYWDKEHLGVIRTEPPEYLTGDVQPTPFNDYLRVVEKPDTDVRRVEGLKSILELPQPLEIEFAAKVKTQSSPEPFDQVEVIYRPIPWNVLVAAVRSATQFLAEIGVEVNLSSADEASFDYSDILDEEEA